jgi:hypothetical protein
MTAAVLPDVAEQDERVRAHQQGDQITCAKCAEDLAAYDEVTRGGETQ